jgi:nanoRNase/pAp phosphatase (c-di-AMP/oligoRNAs hydrolase)
VQEISPTVGYVDTVVGNTNLIVHQLLEKGATQYPVLVTIFRRTNGMMIASFRSRGGEALPVAEKLQGGGHANACGATLPKSLRNVPDAVQFLRQMLNPAKPGRDTPLNSMEALFSAIESKG